MKIRETEQNEEDIGILWDNIQWCHICVIGILEWGGTEEIFEDIKAEHFPNVMTAINLQRFDKAKKRNMKKTLTKAHHDQVTKDLWWRENVKSCQKKKKKKRPRNENKSDSRQWKQCKLGDN